MPKVSVIIPNYNHAAFLKQRIDSVLNQTFQDFELIILDDCSADNSRMIIESYRSHLKVSVILYNDVNTNNTFVQWSKGFDLAKGELIWIAESDDWCEPTFLENLLKGFEKSNCVIASCQSIVVNKNNILWKSEFKNFEQYLNGVSFITNHMVSGNSLFNASMVLFKKESINNISTDFKSFSFCGDWLFWIEIAKQGDVYLSGKYLNYFRKHDQDVSGKAYASGLNFIDEIKILKYLKENKFIDNKLFLDVLKTKYKSFIGIPNLKRRDEILKSFYVDLPTKKFIQKRDNINLKRIFNYIKRYFK